MNIYIAPGKNENIEKSIINHIEYDLLVESNFRDDELNELKDKYGDKKMFAWALGDNRNIRGYLNSLEEGDTIFILNSKLKLVTHKLQFVKLIKNDYLNNNLWDKDSTNKKKWVNILFLKNKIEIKGIDKESISKAITSKGKKPYNFQTFYKLKDFQIEKFNDFMLSFNNISDELIDQNLSNNDNKKSNTISSLIQSLDKNNNIELTFNTDKNKSKNGENCSLRLHKRRKKRSELSELDKKGIGILGEYVFYNYLESNKDKFLSYIGHKGFNGEVTWFNNGINIGSADFEDKSVGIGYDLEIANENKILKFEIKSMFSKSDVINLTHNEMYVMKEESTNNNYFIIIISNLINLKEGKNPEIEVIKNFSDIFSKDTLNYANSMVVNIKKIIDTYKITNDYNY
ncbi:TPA: DUF3883 domain-containing protein [Clostridium perfringens]|uniref:protein NO VEIN domain-containing protein n=1 Tax=Clostridium perfringens TaxID=1502 RepID=UPI00123F4FD8|nr:DUF3883 domain-containing protein [Clostridium perfringens]EGT0013728.1 DUF3883 domain-containing protein [Clostridium perfringens]EJT6339343.1 DUF3883 domain-containing protein [Clostridium perfringens]ELQ0171477.1 DUF3883 domain-containing protein [Clostridium perfringens]MDU7724846.1 DUF3883 domain-containing protein [Clostridium perfringens]UBK99139.1 DUF3883 domain-containing protein [Clostridium perfringens]